MSENIFDDQFDQSEQSIDFAALYYKYMNHWYYFVISVIFMVAAAYVYVKRTTPIFSIDASVIIDDQSDKKSPAAAAGGMDLSSLGIISSGSGFDNEVEIIQSRTLIKNVIILNGLYISYFEDGFFRNSPAYKRSLINAWFSPEDALELEGSFELTIKIEKADKFEIEAIYTDKEGEEIEYLKSVNSLPAEMETPYGTITFTAAESKIVEEWMTNKDGVKDLVVTINNPIAVAKGYLANMSVQPSSKVTTIAQIAIESSSVQKATDFIYSLVDLYNKQANDYKNEIAIKTSQFINERITIINKELGVTEFELEQFKRDAGITDLQSDAQLFLSENSLYQQRLVENNTQLRLVQFLSDYASDPANKYEVLPINVGLADANLSQLIGEYNAMLLERKRLLITSSESNPTIINLNVTIESMLKNVLTTIASVQKGLQITQNDLEREAKMYAGRINTAPSTERELTAISRQRNIQSTLYVMLLQKREENALTLASTANNARIVNEPLPSKDPVSPNKKMILLIALILGVGVPMAIIYLKELLNFKIQSKLDVEAITKLPIVGSTPHIKNLPNDDNSIVVTENNNDMMAEAFRYLRTNVLFMLNGGKKVVLITSTHSGEGKSFMSANLAISLSLMGKKVVLVGLDIRKPGLNEILGTEKKQKGLSSYLSGQTQDLLSLANEVQPNLHVIYGGAIPPNPTELLSRETLPNAIEILRENYDYVILDTAPVGMVIDTLQFSHCADLSIYICRASVTTKAEYELINEMSKLGKLPNLCTAIVGIDISKRGYGYGYGYGFDSNK